MFTTIQFVPGAVSQGQNINIPAYAPKIDTVVSAYLIRPTSQLSVSVSATALTGADLDAAKSDHATAGRHSASVSGGNPVVSVVPTKVDEDTIRLDTTTAAGDILVLTYIAIGSRIRV